MSGRSRSAANRVNPWVVGGWVVAEDAHEGDQAAAVLDAGQPAAAGASRVRCGDGDEVAAEGVWVQAVAPAGVADADGDLFLRRWRVAEGVEPAWEPGTASGGVDDEVGWQVFLGAAVGPGDDSRAGDTVVVAGAGQAEHVALAEQPHRGQGCHAATDRCLERGSADTQGGRCSSGRRRPVRPHRRAREQCGQLLRRLLREHQPEQFRAQMETNFFGPLNVTRAILPVMRKQRSGQVITITSAAGLMGQEFVAAYAASKFALEGWMESLRYDVEPFGITTMAVEPGFFRTELLVEGSSTIWPELDIDDYAERTAQTIEAWKSMNGQQGGDPSKLGRALVTPLRLR